MIIKAIYARLSAPCHLVFFFFLRSLQRQCTIAFVGLIFNTSFVPFIYFKRTSWIFIVCFKQNDNQWKTEKSLVIYYQ